MYATDPHSTIVDGVCQIPVSLFQIIGSVICFYIPLVIMLVTYALTLRLLSKKQSELHAGLLETSSASPSPRSLRWKKLLCKTTSNLSTSTAVSLADGDVSEGGCGSLDARCDEGKLRRFGSSPSRRPPLVRYTSHHYRTALHRGGAAGCPRRGYSAREAKDDEAGAALAGERLLPSLPANAVYELSVTRPGRTSCPRRRRLRSRASWPRTPSSHVAVPCSCAPRFFLEDIKASSGAQCEECAEPRPQEASSTFRSHQHGRKRSHDSGRGKGGRGGSCCACRRRGAGWCCSPEGPDVGWCCSGVLARIASLRHDGSRADGGGLASPWHEGAPRTHDLVARAANLRSGGQVSTMLRKPSSGESSSITSSPSSGRSLWRQQSCTASIKYMSSKKHGRNIRMEQKATKVLGVVFFTFVLLWAPFFIANVLISCGAHIGEEVINLVTWLGYASSMVNPFFYTFFNKTFRQTFLKIIKCQMKGGRKYHF
ncbi:serotonin receptor type 2 [Penaeus vannamei]|uniref:Serotonin receptor type 2 n=1 Tax=Penaeus vannamei TaxID=6689 RepID=A0A3R7SH18_PENVA|nr:serotonin receptor type 2 [Penaeus vannamei]